MPEYAIEVRELRKRYGEVEALAGVEFAVERGELFGMIGPDGAGKTTLIRTLVGLILPEAGEVLVAGLDVTRELPRVKETIGYMSQRFSLYPDLSVEENVHFYGELYRVPRRELLARKQELYRFSRLGEFAKRRAGALSGGMKQKLALCCTLIHTPRILLLDEPTTGVDPLSRREFWDLLAELNRQGTTIFATTAAMDEAGRCHRVGFMFGGKVLALDHPREMPRRYPFRLLEVRVSAAVESLPLVESLPEVRSVQVFGDRLHVAVERVEQAREALSRRLAPTARGQAGEGGRPPEIREIAPGLEDVFVELIRQAQRSPDAASR